MGGGGPTARLAEDKSDGGETQWTAEEMAEANGGVLSVDAVEHVRDIFHEIDQDKSGHIDLNEFKVNTRNFYDLGAGAFPFTSWLSEVLEGFPDGCMKMPYELKLKGQ